MNTPIEYSIVQTKLFLCALILLFGLTGGCGDSRLAKKWGGSHPPEQNEVIRKKPKKPRYTKPPSVSTEPVITTDIIEENLTQARTYLEQKEYERIPPLTASILVNAPDKTDTPHTPADNSAVQEAQSLSNAAYYQMGLRFYNKNQYLQALEMFDRVDPDYENLATLLSALRQEMKVHADVLYKQGVKYFINEELSSAIASWEKALALNPDHPKAEQDIENAEDLLKKLEKIQ